MEAEPPDDADYSVSAFLLAVAAALQSGGYAMNILPYVWALAAAALLYKFLTGSRFIRQHFPRLSGPPIAGIVSALALGAIVFANYAVPAVSLRIENREPYVIRAQTDGVKWVKIAATRRSSGEGICRGYIDELLKDDNSTPIIQGEHRLLGADDGGDPGLSDGFHMGSGMERFFNIARIDPGENTLHIASKAFNDLIRTPLGPGTYRAKIEVSGLDCGPAYADVTIKYAGHEDVSVVPTRSSWWPF